MDKITRIHLAKVPYDIETAAQTALQKYLHDIQAGLDNDMAEEIMTDIELRITEILSDRGVKRNDVITAKDIQAIEEQLGSPEQFTDAEDDGRQKYQSGSEAKRLLRDTDDALIGGVASGLAAYFNIDPIITRVLFIALTFASGLGVLLYIILWILMPAAKTNSDKLLMRGERVTAAALQRYRSTAQKTITNLRLRAALLLVYKIFRVVFTLGVAIIVLALLASTGVATAVLYTQPLQPLFSEYHPNYILLGLVWLLIMTVIGLLVILLLRLWHQRALSLKIPFIIFAGLLLLTLAGIATVSPFIVDHYNNRYGSSKLTVAIPVHNGTKPAPATTLQVLADSNLHIDYVVTDQPLHATYQAYPGMERPPLSIVNANGTVALQANQLEQVVPKCLLNWCSHVYLPVRVTLYGPAVQKVSVDGGAEVYINDLVQPRLTLQTMDNSELSVDNSYSDNLTLSAASGSSIFASDTTAQEADISVQTGSSIYGPASNTVRVTLPGNCLDPLLFLAQSPVSVTLNGHPTTVAALSQNSCVNMDNPPPFIGNQVRDYPSPAIPQAP